MRLEWYRLQAKAAPAPAARELAGSERFFSAQSLRNLVSALAEDLDRASRDEDMAKANFASDTFRIGLGIATNGDVGVVKAGLSAVGSLYFSRDITKPKPASRAIEGGYAGPVLLVVPGARGGEALPIDREAFRKGMKKSLRMGRYFAERAARSNKKKSNWKIYQVKTSFELSTGGDVGVAKLNGVAVTEFEFKNRAY